MAIKVSANLRPWAAMRALAGEMDDIAELFKMLEEDGFEVATRYGTGADALPDLDTMCPGQCEGLGIVPIDAGILPEDHPLRLAEEVTVIYDQDDVDRWRDAYLAAESEEPAEGGYHFLTCPDCGGTGKRSSTMSPDKEAITQAVGEAASIHWPESGEAFDSTKASEIADELARELGVESRRIGAVRAGRKTIVFDFDGTIAEELPFPQIGAPIWETIERMRAARDAGIEVVIQSCRWSEHELSTAESAAENLVIAKAWLEANDVPYDRLQAGKPLADLYVDDKACHVNDLQRLDQVIMELASEHPVDGSLSVRAFGETHEWGCLMLEAPDDLSAEVRAWGEKNVPQDALFLDKDDPKSYGRESQIHATVSYGIDPEVPADELKALIKGPLKVRLGKVSKFDKKDEGYDVIKIEVDSDDLRALHGAIEKAVGTPGNTYPDYKPHMTVAYVKPGSCDALVGQEPFKGREMVLGTFDYGRPETPGEKDVHDHFDAPAGPRAALRAAQFDDLRKAALRLIEDDPAWKQIIQDPASAQAYGRMEQDLRDARSDEELQSAWEANMDMPWAAVKAEAGGRKNP